MPFLIELYCQICIIGFKPTLTEKLLNVYSYSKNMKFYAALLILSLFFGCIFVFAFTDYKEEIKKEQKRKKILKYFIVSFAFIITLINLTFITSVCYLTQKNLTRERWNNIIMAEFIIFKIIDFQILYFYDFFDNSDIFNTTLAITIEKLLWMIFETIIDAYVKNKRWLVLVQIIWISLTVILPAIISIIYACIFV